MPQPPQNLRSFDALMEVIQILRGPEGCPWDKEQTHQSLIQFAIEEVKARWEEIKADENSQKNNQQLESLSLDERETLWARAKSKEKENAD